jgi:hypothetical protein
MRTAVRMGLSVPVYPSSQRFSLPACPPHPTDTKHTLRARLVSVGYRRAGRWLIDLFGGEKVRRDWMRGTGTGKAGNGAELVGPGVASSVGWY